MTDAPPVQVATRRLGFNTRVSFPTGEAARGLRDGIDLFRVAPHGPGLRERIWYGSGSIASAVTAARQGLRLITGTILHDVPAGESFPSITPA